MASHRPEPLLVSNRACRAGIRWVNGEPKILAGGVPIISLNSALRHRAGMTVRHANPWRRTRVLGAHANLLRRTKASACWTLLMTVPPRRLSMAYLD